MGASRRETAEIFLLGDADTIKGYVFEAPGLPQIRGGSLRLVECEKLVQNFVEKHDGKTIYCSGGGFLFKVPMEQAKTIKSEIERIYLHHTLTSMVTVVHEGDDNLPPPGPDIADGWAGRLVKAHLQVQQAGEFARRIAFLAARLREAKQQKRTAPFIEAFPFGHRCDICGKRVAAHTVLYPDETKRLCHVCYNRHQTGQSKRHRAFDEFAKKQILPVRAKPARDLDSLVESAHRSYVAFFYADGNNIGDLLQQVKDELDFRALSEVLRQGTERALLEALWEVCQPVLEREGAWPFEIINIGGDDVTLLIQAGYAWDVAIAFLEKFQRYVRWGNQPITASVGIAIADVKHPVRYLEALAEDTLKRAKKVAKDHGTSAIDFLWLPNAIAVTEAKMVDDLYRRGDLVLTARPYTLEQARAMQEVVDILAQWPRSLRHRWGEALDRGRWSSLSLILYDLARRMNQKRQEVDQLLNALQKLTHSLGRPGEVSMGYLWWEGREDDGVVWRTALLDALELAELKAMRPDVQEEEEG
jgi:GGDEF domain-containing protein